VPLWALAQVNQTSEHAAVTEGERIIVPRYLVPKAGAEPGLKLRTDRTLIVEAIWCAILSP
jgi:hypothetical protein